MQIAVVTSHASLPRRTGAILASPMAGPPLRAHEAVEHLLELSSDIRAAYLLDARGRLSASAGVPDEHRSEAGRLLRALWGLADRAADRPAQIEVTGAGGGVFAVRGERHSLAVTAGRSALPSLMFYDLRIVLGQLERKAA